MMQKSNYFNLNDKRLKYVVELTIYIKLMNLKQVQHSIYINKPKRIRRYLIQKPPPPQSERKTNLLTLHQSLQNDEFLKSMKKEQYKSSFALISPQSRKKESFEARNKTIIPSKLTIQFKKSKKGSQSLISQRRKLITSKRKLLTIETSKQKNNQKPNIIANISKLISPLISTNQQKLINFDRKGKISQRKKSLYKNGQYFEFPLLNFTPKYRSVHKMSIEVGDNKSIKKDFIEGFIKQKIIGKGGFSQVWQAIQIKTRSLFAVKQIDLSNQYQTHLAEINFSNYFFQNGLPKPKFAAHPGIEVLLKMEKFELYDSKCFIVYEKCTGPLGSYLFDLYQQNQTPEQSQKQKCFLIVHKPLYTQMKQNCNFLKNVIYQVAQALDLLQICNIVHSDVKTSNILIKEDEQNQNYSIKLIDYGSSFTFQRIEQYRLATAEYMPPQLINFFIFKNKKKYNQELLSYIQYYSNISAIDMWGLGCIILQIIYGIPMWLNFRVKIQNNQNNEYKSGLFATSSRSYQHILQKQIHVIKNLNQILQKENNLGIVIDDKIKTIVLGLLEINPYYRLRPKQVIQILNQDFQ